MHAIEWSIYGPRISSFREVSEYKFKKKKKKKKNNHEILNKHLFSINKSSTKKNIQNHCFVIHYNATIYKQRQRYEIPLFLTTLKHLH